MITHIVLWTLKEQAEGRGKKENAQLIVNELLALKNRIPEIVTIDAGIDFNMSDAAFDVALVTTFKNKADLEIYQKHPDHLKAAELVGKVRAERAVVDFES